MKIRLRRMTVSEFELFKKYRLEDYAEDLIKDSERSKEEAMIQSEKEFTDMLMDGVDTPNNDLIVIEDCYTGKNVGVIWYLYEFTDGVKHTFLCDFIVKEEERRKGYATAALYEMEKEVSKHGCTECRLYVWKHNSKGIDLYKKVRYKTLRDEVDGMYMKKPISM